MSYTLQRRALPLLVITTMLVSFVPGVASAVHDAGLFELDGNATAGAAAGDDWSTLFPTNTSSTVFSEAFAHEPPTGDTTYFSIASKDINDVSTWSATGNSAPPKDEILDAFAATYNTSAKGNIVYFGADRWANNGDAAIGFWFLQDDVNITSAGAFTGSHVRNDTLVVSHFTNGGAVATIYVYSWQPGATDNLVLLATGQDCSAVGANDMACAKVNSGLTDSPWPYQGSGSKDPANKFPANSFFEGGMNLTALYGGNVPCFNTFITETRSSQETTATLKDLVLHKFNNCPIVPPQATIIVEKVPLQPIVDLGQPIGYGITVSNSGPDPAENTTLWDVLPNVSGAWSVGGTDAAACSIDNATRNLTCSFGTLNVFDSRYVEVTAGTSVVSDCGWQPNDVFITANGGLSNDHSFAQLYVTCSDVGVVKTAGAAVVDLGQNVSYAIVVTSYGPDDAANVTLADTLPSLSGAWDLGGDNATDCSVAGTALSCDFGTVPVNATRSITLTASTSVFTDCGWQNNTASVTARVDTDPTNNASSASAYVHCSDTAVFKAADPSDVYLGANVTFTISVRSLGPDAAENVTLNDTLADPPGGWAIVSSDGSCSIASGVLTCDFGTVPFDEWRNVTVTAATSDATTDCGLVNNTAYALSSVELKSNNNEASANVTVRCSAVSIAKTAAASSVDVGGNVTFTVTVSSLGPDAANNVTVVDALPAISGGWAFVPGGDEASCGIAGLALTCDFGTVAAGATRSFTVTATTSLTDCGVAYNLANASAAVDTTSGDDSANATERVACADVGVAKTAAWPTVDLGANVSFEMTVTSYGPDAAENVTLSDTLPGSGATWSLGGADAGACSVTGSALSCDFGTVPAGETRTVKVTAATSATTDCGWWNNTATVAARLDTNATNNASSASAYVTCADVGLDKTAGGDVDVGGNATFTLTVTSLGPDPAENATITDALPSIGTSWAIAPGGDGASCGIANGTLTCDFGTLASGATRTVTITGTTTTADCAGVTNAATAGARLDTNATNNGAQAFVDVTCADVGVLKSADASHVTAGSNATWTVTIWSLGPDDAENVTLLDYVTNGTFLALTGNASSYCSIAAPNVTCSIPTLAAGSYLTLGIVTSTTPADCGLVTNVVTVGARVDTDLTNDEASATLTVDCPSNATRTQGFWSTHTDYTKRVFDQALGGTMTVGTGGHTRTIDTYGKLFGAWYSSIPYKTTGHKRAPVDSARVALLQQLVTAKLNCAAFGCNGTIQATIAAADAAYAGNNRGTMATYTGLLDAYNNGGDGVALPTTYGSWNPASPDASQAIANRVFWDDP